MTEASRRFDRARRDRGARVASAAGSLVGFAAAVAIAVSLPSRPAPGQLIGYALVHGFDPHTDVLRLILLAVLPLIGGVAGGLLASKRSRLATDSRGPAARPLSRFAWSTDKGLFLSAVGAHALVVWTFLVGPLLEVHLPALVSLLVLAAVSGALAFGLGRTHGRGDRQQGAELLAASSPILAFTFLGPKPAAYWLAVGVAGLILPLVARGIVGAFPASRRILRILLLWVLLPGSVTGLVNAAVNRAPIVGDVFEDGHGLLPASEYRNGERPYRDIVPGHGLVSDGLLQAAQLAVFGDDYLGLKRGTKVVGLFFLPAFYALGWVASGSAAVGFGGLVLTLLVLPNYLFFRALLSVWTLVFAIFGSRTRSRAAWFACGVALPIGLCVAVDFTAYAAAGSAVALFVARGRRRDHLRRLLAGVAISAGMIALALAAFGILGDFARTTFVFVPSLLPVYALGFPPVGPSKGDLSPNGWLSNQVALGYAFLAVAAIVSGALLPRAPRVGARARGLLPVLAWIGCGMLSVIERHHVTYPLLAAPVCLVLLDRWARGGRRGVRAAGLASGLALVAIALGRQPWSFVAGAGEALARPYSPPGVRAVEGVPRARGAVFFPGDANLIEATARTIREANLGADDTWLDFANAPGLYYLFDRNCPIRYYEVPFYESESAQREVIEAVAANPRVRLVLFSSGLLAQTIDDIANPERAPRVAAFLRERFRPFSAPGAVEFWIRKADADAGRVSAGRP